MVIVSQRKYVPYLFELRWCLVYRGQGGGRDRQKQGVWTRPSPRDEDNARRQPKVRLRFALIEGKRRDSRRFKVFARVKAQDYIEHRWIAAIAAPLRPGPSFRGEGAIQGMTLVTKKEKINVFIDGTITKVKNDEPGRP